MTSVSWQANTLVIDGTALSLAYAIREAFALDDKIIVLLDPNAYLSDPSYSKERRRGENALHNLLALTANGETLWEAEFPEQVDYYYEVSCRSPLTALSFSSFRCEIDPRTGKIIRMDFLK
jgi:hypothetical protein